MALKQSVVLCDSHPMIQEGVARILGQDFDLVGTAPDGRSARTLIRSLSPTLVILEVGLPVLNGFEISRELRAFEPRPKVVFYTACSSPAYVREGFLAGASAYVSKAAPVQDLLTAVKAAARGNQIIYLPGREGALIFRQSDDETRSPFGDLTPRQCQVLQLVGEGLSAKAIAAELNIVQKTVEFHKTTMMTALRLKSSAELVRYSVECGLVGSMNDPCVKAIANQGGARLRRTALNGMQAAQAAGHAPNYVAIENEAT